MKFKKNVFLISILILSNLLFNQSAGIIGSAAAENSHYCQSCNSKSIPGLGEVKEYPVWASSDNNKPPLVIRLTEPTKVDFIPMLSNIKQLEYIDWQSAQPPMISIGYISRESSSQVIAFYLNKMPSYGWHLTEQKPRQGTYQLAEWLPMLAPYTSTTYSRWKEVLPAEIPPLRIQGATLTFTKGSQKCVITVYTFEDIIQRARQQIVYDLTFMEDYGTTIIGIAYFY